MKIGEYSIIEKIGEGGFGSVYKVEKDGVLYALKICSNDEEEDIRRFKREVRLSESVNHKNVIDILDVDFTHIPPYFVMPLCESSLEKKKYNGDIEMLIEDVLQVCDGLKILHNNYNAIIHRDIKPSNILILNDTLKLADLGLGKFEDRDTTTLTTNGTSLGTVGFAPPEFYMYGGTRNATISSDIYQLGKTIYSLYTGENSLYIDKTKIPNGLYYIIKRCTNESPTDRYQNVEELCNALIKHLEVLRGNNNPYNTFDNLIEEMKKKQVSEKEVYNLFNTLYEFKEDSKTFYSKVKDIPIDYFTFLNEGDLHTFVEVYNDVVIGLNDDGALSWSDAETIAQQMKKVFNSTENVEIRTTAMKTTLFFAASFNRYAAMDIFNNMLSLIKTDGEAVNIAAMLNDNINDYENIVLQKDEVINLHPKIQSVRYNILINNKK